MASTPYTFADVVRKLAADLKNIDLELLGKDLKAAENISDEAQIYELIAKSCAEKSLIYPHWGLLAGRIMTEDMRRTTPLTFSGSTLALKKQLDAAYAAYVEEHANELNAMIVPDRDYMFDSFAVATAKQSYLSRIRNEKNKSTVVETMQYMYLRVATYCWMPNLLRIKEAYDDMSLGRYTPASPTLFNAGKFRPQLASCFLLKISDNLPAISKGWKDTAIISMNRGGLGLDYTPLRHSEIEGSGGESKGIMPWIKIQNEIIKSVDQGGMRKGSATVNLRVGHVDIEEFVEARKGDGAEHMRARDLFYCVVLDDLFMRRVKNNEMWSLFCPNKAKGLFTTWGLEYETLYIQYENKKYYSRQVRARDLWRKIIHTQIETGMPFLLHIDAVNRKSNQRNKGYIGQSNLCVSGDTKILTDRGEVPIVSLKDRLVNVWNGEQWSPVTVKQTGSNENLLRVTLSSGRYIDCTADHFFYVMDKATPFKINAAKLRQGMKLEPFFLPGVGEVHISVVSVTEGPQDVDTYCFTEPKRNRGVFNGALTSQCMEITEYTSDEEIASCNLSSIALNSCVVVPEDDSAPYFDFHALTRLARNLVRNLNQVIDRNYYPPEVPEIKYANFKNRPLGLGVQGLADAFAMLDLAWVINGVEGRPPVINPVAAKLNRDIFETIYYAAVRESVEMAKETGPYESFAGSPASKGLFQFDLWDIEKMEKEALSKPLDAATDILKFAVANSKNGQLNSRYSSADWENLRSDMVKYGRRNSLIVALMPTASSASILGNNEAFEPFNQNIYARTVLSGQHLIINKHMVKDLQAVGLWTTETVHSIIKSNGSAQFIPPSPDPVVNARLEFIKLKYLTAYEIPQRVTLQMMLDRGRFVCQSQSFNCFMKDPTYEKLNAFHFAAWEGGATTGMYYLRQPPAVSPLNVSLDGLVIAAPPPLPSAKTPEKKKEYKCDDLSCCT